MALVYDNQGEYEKALEWYEKGLEIKLKTLGPDHPSTATTYFNLGALYDNMKDYKTSLENLELALAIYLKSFGPNHPQYIRIKSWIAEDRLRRYQSFGKIFGAACFLYFLELFPASFPFPGWNIVNALIWYTLFVVTGLVILAGLIHEMANTR